VWNSAIALELLHNAFLVHDDVEDGSVTRRGAGTINSLLNPALAINVGDALSILAFQRVAQDFAEQDPISARIVLRELGEMCLRTTEGQARELGWIAGRRCTLSMPEYLRMVLNKTCWYSFIEPCRLGFLAARCGRLAPERFVRFGFFLGAAFQIRDDVLNLAPVEEYGKESAGDIWEGKPSILMVHLFGVLSAVQRRRLATFLSRPRGKKASTEAMWVQDLIRAHGSAEWAMERALALARAARSELAREFRQADRGPDLLFIADLTAFAVSRER
jgi:geranylgeranyl diphosphate synthase type II